MVDKLSVKVRRQNRRTMLMKVETGGVVVFIPRWLNADNQEVKAFIAEGLKRLEDKIPPARPQVTTLREIRVTTLSWAKKMGLFPNRITVRDMRRKWGSCSSKGNITLNSALCTLPFSLAEYVIVHELAHLKVFEHSPEFWELVGQYLPDYDERRKTLDTYLV